MLSDSEIRSGVQNNTIRIDPFFESQLQPNSYDVTLGKFFYRAKPSKSKIFNIWSPNEVKNHWELNVAKPFKEFYLDNLTNNDDIYLDVDGLIHFQNIKQDDLIIWLHPLERILAHTFEYIGGRKGITSMMAARSSMGRNYISVCLCSNIGTVGYVNRYTMEITNHSTQNIIPLIVGERIAQIAFFKVGDGEKEYSGSYQENGGEEWKPEDMLPKLRREK